MTEIDRETAQKLLTQHMSVPGASFQALKETTDEGQNPFFALNVYSKGIHEQNVASGWWTDPLTGERKERNRGELLMLVVTEIAEAMEGVRKGINDDHLTDRLMEEVEIADALIRIFDYCGAYDFDIAGALCEKWLYNQQRADHKMENRIKEGGKKC